MAFRIIGQMGGEDNLAIYIISTRQRTISRNEESDRCYFKGENHNEKGFCDIIFAPSFVL